MLTNLVKFILASVTFGSFYFLYNLFLPDSFRMYYAIALVLWAIIVIVSDQNWFGRLVLGGFALSSGASALYLMRAVQTIANPTWDQLLAPLVQFFFIFVMMVVAARYFAKKQQGA